MKQDTKTLLIAGGCALVAGGLIYVLTRGSKSDDLDSILVEVSATRSGPDYETVLVFGGWTLDRERQYSYPNLGPGSIAKLRLYPSKIEGNPQTGYSGPHFDYAVQITKATRVGGFTVYEGKWINTPGGLDPNDFIRFTSADVSSVAQSVSDVA